MAKYELIEFDKGHGGNDPGAVNAAQGLKEADLVDKIVDYTIAELSKYNVKTRVAPRPAASTAEGRLGPRSADAKKAGADFFVSYHINAAGGTGWESFIYTVTTAENDRVAKAIHNEIAEWFAKQGIRDRGMQRKNLHVLRNTAKVMPSMLLEFGFIDNAKDYALLKQESKLKEMGVVSAKAIVNALGLTLKNAPAPAPTTGGSSVTGVCNVVVNDKKLEEAGINYSNKAFVPVRAVAEVVGVTAGWDANASKATLNGVKLETTYNHAGVGFAHSVEVAKVLGYSVKYVNTNSTVYLSK